MLCEEALKEKNLQVENNDDTLKEKAEINGEMYVCLYLFVTNDNDEVK